MPPRLVTGDGVGGQFVAEAEETLSEAVGFRPFHGTLNLEGATVDGFPPRTLDEVGTDPCEGVRLRDCSVAGVRAAVVRPLVPDYPPEKTEVLAPVKLRALFGFDAGDVVALRAADDVWPPSGTSADPTALDRFDAVVFDLDGTLVDLVVDWANARTEIRAEIGDHLDRPIRDYGPSGLFRVARERGVYDDLAAILAAHERTGAEEATALPLLGTVDLLSCPVGVCTANASEAAERALATFDARGDVDVVVGRDSVRGHKPEPEPLLACLEDLGADPGNAVFVGDMEDDAETARRAGSSFLAPDQLSID